MRIVVQREVCKGEECKEVCERKRSCKWQLVLAAVVALGLIAAPVHFSEDPDRVVASALP